jgi:PEP-CTERM motif
VRDFTAPHYLANRLSTGAKNLQITVSDSQLWKIRVNASANIRLMESVVNPSASNRFSVLTGLARCHGAGAAMVLSSALALPALASTITFETAGLGVFTAPVTEDGFTYSKLSGGLFVNTAGNPGHDLEGLSTVGGGVLKIISAGGGDFNFSKLDFSAFNSLGTGSQTLKIEGFLAGSSVGADQYTLANTKVFNPKYDNWTTEAASVLAGKSISELDITLNASVAGSGLLFNESIDNVVLTPEVAAVPEPASLALLGVAVVGASCFRLRRRRPLAA